MSPPSVRDGGVTLSPRRRADGSRRSLWVRFDREQSKGTEMTAMTTQTTLYETFDSPIGDLLAVGDGEALTGLYMQDGGRPVTVPGSWEHAEEPFGELREQLREYFNGARREFELSLAPRGTEFQLGVWDALREIPYGETESYGELAARIGRPGSARAVGAANGQNPIAVVVPCHRVIGASGSLTGYAGGLERKRLLLDLESPPARLDPRSPSAR
jgi:methylated-DNA-[protein]-cysteine S-methyltransferase